MTEPTTCARVRSMFDFRWDVLIRPRLDGLTDEEYRWEPAAGCLTVRPDGADGYTLDQVTSSEPPLGTFAWRTAHLTACLATHSVAAVAFGPDWPAKELAAPVWTADEALDRLDRACAHWRGALAALSDAGLDRRLGPAAHRYAESTVLDIVLHVHAEALQRGADLCLLRDLYWHLHRPRRG